MIYIAVPGNDGSSSRQPFWKPILCRAHHVVGKRRKFLINIGPNPWWLVVEPPKTLLEAERQNGIMAATPPVTGIAGADTQLLARA
jgi:hypothetical protein